MLITQCAIHWSKLYFAVAGSILILVNLKVIKVIHIVIVLAVIIPGAGVLPIMDYGEALPKRGTFFRLQVYKRVEISQVEVQLYIKG